ncbi:hypothetical protein DCAR_0728657 [Daucus carota subsp. sativus]|uniref:DUF1985 domain-containing protein n=1 Tax=Daucus carota subsp. sativus TaxID=79200 RepID=A0AAF1B9U6_DAUCS|nr:hypothetical protein DCAR_0728657 [Daucus carota subsp. sativus]
MPNFKIQHQLIHNLVLRQLKQLNKHEIWIGVGGKKLKFGIEEFATITGLRCVGNPDKMRCAKANNNFVSTYYEGYKTISRSDVKKSFFAREWKSDEDAVKMGKLYFLHHFLLTSSNDTHVPKGDLDLLDGNQFDEFPWGKEVFRMTVDSLKSCAKTSSKDNYYRLTGFPYAFQVWFYECCPYLNGKYCDQNESSIPRILNWTTDYSGRFEEFYTTLSLDSKEICDLNLVALFPTTGDVNQEPVNQSDDDFVEPFPQVVKCISTVERGTCSNVGVSTTSDSLIKKLQRQIKTLEGNEKRILTQVEELKNTVQQQRATLIQSC